jgi:hypothetical protein
MPTGPTGRRDESVQFSLKELLKLEDERLVEQERTTLAREAEHTRALEEEARRRRVDEETAAKLEAETLDRRRQTELEELARREAMQKAIVEQGRLEVEVRARADERERERRHEIELERLRAETKTGPSLSLGGMAGAAAMGGAIMLVVALGIHFGVVKPTSERRSAELQSNVTTAETHADDLGRQLNEQRRLVADRDRQLADLRIEVDALKARKPTPTPASAPTVHKPNLPKTQGGGSQPEAPCPKGDPMCF